MNPNKLQEVRDLATFIEGMAEATTKERAAERLESAAKWLRKLTSYMCSQGYIGCRGENCQSDHK